MNVTYSNRERGSCFKYFSIGLLILVLLAYGAPYAWMYFGPTVEGWASMSQQLRGWPEQSTVDTIRASYKIPQNTNPWARLYTDPALDASAETMQEKPLSWNRVADGLTKVGDGTQTFFNTPSLVRGTGIALGVLLITIGGLTKKLPGWNMIRGFLKNLGLRGILMASGGLYIINLATLRWGMERFINAAEQVVTVAAILAVVVLLFRQFAPRINIAQWLLVVFAIYLAAIVISPALGGPQLAGDQLNLSVPTGKLQETGNKIFSWFFEDTQELLAALAFTILPLLLPKRNGG